MQNTIFTILVVFLAMNLLIDAVADYLNLRSFPQVVPKELDNVYDSDRLSKTRSYIKANSYLSSIKDLFDFALLLALVLAGGFAYFDEVAKASSENIIARGLIFIGLYALIQMIATLPFSIIDTFVVEARFGFNKTTAKTFITDLIKGIIISAILASIIFSVVILLFQKLGHSAWLLAWIMVTLFQILILFIAPALIMPLFNKFTPINNPELLEKISKYFKSRDFQVSGVYQMDGSKRSSKANAFFTGFGKFRRLVLFDTLIEKHSIDELIAVLAHEVGHFKKRHILKSLAMSIVSSAILFYTLSLMVFSEALSQAFRVYSPNIYSNIVFAGILYSPLSRFISIIPKYISRVFEYEADAFAGLTTGKPEMLVAALKKLSADNLSHPQPSKISVILNYTHPPVLARIRALAK